MNSRIKEGLDVFIDDNFYEAKEIFSNEISRIRNEYLKKKLGLNNISEAKLEDLSSGMLKRKKSIEALKKVLRGEDNVSVVTAKGTRTFSVVKKIRGDQLEAGQIVLSCYNAYNQGASVDEVLGFTGDEKPYGEGGVKFKTCKELLNHYNVKSLKELEKLQKENPYGHTSYMVVKDLEENDSGPYYYLNGGAWCRGSGAEKLDFYLLKEEKK